MARARTDIEMQKHSLIAVAVALFAAGCTLAPKYERPAAPVTSTSPTRRRVRHAAGRGRPTAGSRRAQRNRRGGGRHRLARLLRRSAPAAADRHRAEEQPRSAGVGARTSQASQRASSGSLARRLFPTLDARGIAKQAAHAEEPVGVRPDDLELVFGRPERVVGNRLLRADSAA